MSHAFCVVYICVCVEIIFRKSLPVLFESIVGRCLFLFDMLTTFKCKFSTEYEQVDDLYYPYYYAIFYYLL